MSLVRDLGITLPAMQDTVLATCSYYLSTAASTSPIVKNMQGTGDALITTGGTAASTAYGSANGAVIDRLAPPLNTLYNVAMPSVLLVSTNGSTEANRAVQIGVKLQHGDSSGGGDMADYSTASQPAFRNYFSTKRSTDALNWEVGGRSTGTARLTSNPAYYDLRAAKQYIRTVAMVALPGRTATTESTAEEGSRVSAQITFLAGASLPQGADVSPISSATSTV